MKYELPAPPSANNMYRHQSGRHHKSKVYLQWLEACQWLICMPPPKLIEGDVKMVVTIRPKDYRLRDTDNYAKPLCDLFEGVLYKNDRQVTELTLKRMKPNGGMHDLVVEITSLDQAAGT